MSGDIKDDPIFEVIEAHRRADASFMEAMRAQHRRHDDKGSDMVDALENASSEATIRLLSTTPTTLPGTIALLRYVLECEAAGNQILKIDRLGGTGPRADLELCARLLEALERIGGEAGA
jgi:hypothetical protein